MYNTNTNSQPLTKVEIKDFLNQHNGDVEGLLKLCQNNTYDIINVLDNLGKLSTDFDGSCLIKLLNSENENVRILAVKNIGKIKSEKYLMTLREVAYTDKSTLVCREAVSSIGRLRNRIAIPTLIDLLSHNDPKIVCQAIRGLLVFKGVEYVDNALKSLKDHENETVRDVVQKEYFFKSIDVKNVQPHTETYSYLKNTVVNGDVLDVLNYVPDESVHLTFTSPPYYNARDYSIYPSYEAYLNFLNKVFQETYRITKEGRFLIVNTSPVIVPRISRAHSSKRYPIPFDLHYFLVKMGWEFIDDIVWEKPEYSVKNRVSGFRQYRKPLAYKPNAVTEYLMVYRKKTDRLIDWNIHQYSSEIVAESKVADDFETTNVWKICPKSDKVHSAIFPEELCKRVIEYYSYKGDLIFDPFAGSGTLGRTAEKLGRKFFLTEKEPVYFEYMKTLHKKDSKLKDESLHFLSLEQFKNNIL